MQEVVKLALAKKLEKETKNWRLHPGHYNIDEIVTLRLQGVVTKGDDVEYTPTVDIPLLTTMALLLEKAGFQRENAKSLLVEAMTEALAFDEHGDDHVAERVKDIEAAMVHVRQVTNALPKKIRTGPTTLDVNLTVVE